MIVEYGVKIFAQQNLYHCEQKNVWEMKPQAKIVENLLNCLEYGHILGQINPSTQIIVDHRVESL